MNCENIHKKHTGSHLQNILNQKSWSEVKVKWMLLSEHTSIKMIKTATYEDLQRDTQTKAIHPPLTYQTPQLLLCGMKLLLHWRIKKKKECIPLKSSKTNAFRCNALNTIP